MVKWISWYWYNNRKILYKILLFKMAPLEQQLALAFLVEHL